MSYRTLAPGQRSQVWVGGPDLPEPELLLETDELLVEAPNWSSDGDALFLNGNGVLWRRRMGGMEFRRMVAGVLWSR